MSSNDLYSVDHDVLKDYIKRQMWVYVFFSLCKHNPLSNKAPFSSSIFGMKLSLGFCLQWVLLQPGQSGTGLFSAEEDGPRGLPAHWAHCQFPQSAGPHHQHRPHCGSKGIFFLQWRGILDFTSSSIHHKILQMFLKQQKCVLASLSTLRKLIFCPARLWRTVKKSKWLTWRSAGRRTHWSGLFRAWPCQTKLTPTSLNLSTVLSLYPDSWLKRPKANVLDLTWNLKTSLSLMSYGQITSVTIMVFIFCRLSQDLQPSKTKAQDGLRHFKPQDDAQGPLCQSPGSGLRVLDRGQKEAETLSSQTQGQRREGDRNHCHIISKFQFALCRIFCTIFVTNWIILAKVDLLFLLWLTESRLLCSRNKRKKMTLFVPLCPRLAPLHLLPPQETR